MSEWRRAWSLGRRELDWKFRGLRLLFVSLFLGVAALATVGSLATAMERGLRDRGREILGGDIEFARSSAIASAAERSPFEKSGRVSQSIRMTSSAVIGARSIPIQLKAVDDRYPLYGALRLADGRKVGMPASGEAWIDPGLGAQLPVGSRFRLGTATIKVGGIIQSEPDRLGEGFSLGPTVIVGLADLTATGLDQPGSLFEARYRIATTSDPAALATRVMRDFPASGWEAKTRDNAAPGAGRFVGRMAEFLTLVVLTSLVIAAIGIANAVTSFLRARQANIATLKILGATSPLIARIYALQIGWTGAAATFLGLATAIAAVPLIGRAAARLLPFPLEIAPAWGALGLATGLGLLVVTGAAAIPLARAARVPPAALLRGSVEARGDSWKAGMPWVIGSGVGLVGLALAEASRPALTAGFLGTVGGVIALLAALGGLVRFVAARAPRLGGPFARLAIAGLHRPGASTIGLVVALGVGLTMFVQIAAVRSSFDANLRADLPARAPALFVLDVPRERASDFIAAVRRVSPSAEVQTVPLLRGTITGYGKTNVADLEKVPDGAWALRGERGLTYAATLPAGSVLTAGQWWPADYRGPPLVSVDERLAAAIGLKLGDELRFSLFGVERRATVASFRRIEWGTMGFNFVLVFSPNTLADVPHNLSATISLTDGKVQPVRDAIAARFPSSSQVPVGDVLEQVRSVADGVAIAIAWAAAATILAGIAVLAGTTASMREARSYDAVMLRVLGATRGQLLRLQALEFALVALLVSAVALGLGLLAGWAVVTRLFDMRWAPDPLLVAQTLAGGIVIVFLVGLLTSLPSLGRRPSEALRNL